jgi:hypothetical protein
MEPMIRVSKKLNLAIPIEMEDGTNIHVHSTPIGVDVFDTYYRNLSRVFGEIYGGNMALTAARICWNLIKDDAVLHGNWEGSNGVAQGFFGEVWRLTNVVHPGPKGWQITQWEDAVKSHMLFDDDVIKVKNLISYFMLASVMHGRNEMEQVEFSLKPWGGLFTPLNCTEYRDTLPMLTPAADTPMKVTVSSIPS